MDTGNFIVHVKLKSIDVDLARVVATKSDTSNYEGKRTLPIRRNKKRTNERWIRWQNNERVYSPDT